MDKKDFTGNVKGVSPNIIIKEDDNNELDNFFLVLGLIYNDLKNLIIFSRSISEIYRTPLLDGTEPVSAHVGEWGGIQTYLNKVIISTISEFFIFLDKNRSTINSIQFSLLVKKLPDDVRSDWHKIILSLDDSKTNDFLSKLAQIRNNVAFHYDQSLTQLKSGYIKKFYKDTKDKYNSKAFYSIGSGMSDTRFYYCDGALEAYLRDKLIPDTTKNYFLEIPSMVEKMNKTFFHLIRIHIEKR